MTTGSTGKILQPREILTCGGENVHITKEADIFMLGMTIFYIAAKEYPYSSGLVDTQNAAIINQENPSLHLVQDKLLRSLIFPMLSHDPAKRPKSDWISNHPYMLKDAELGAQLKSYKKLVIRQDILIYCLEGLYSHKDWYDLIDPMIQERITIPHNYNPRSLQFAIMWARSLYEQYANPENYEIWPIMKKGGSDLRNNPIDYLWHSEALCWLLPFLYDCVYKIQISCGQIYAVNEIR